MSESPLRRLREERGLTSQELALASCVAPYRISQAERGLLPIPAQVLATFSRLGEDADALLAEHRRWCADAREEVIARASGRGGPIPGRQMVAPSAACLK